eukprot:s29_g23.t1
MSQRYCFLSALAARLPELKIVVHDDACHLRRMAESEAGVRELTQRLARDIHYTDEYHTPGHVGSCCREPCLPTIDTPEHFSHEYRRVGELLFVAFAAFAHTFHHMGSYMAKFAAMEVVDVHNILAVQIAAARKGRARDREIRKLQAEASGEQESASRALDLERKRGQDLAQALSQALHQRQRVADEAEHRAVAAEREKFNLEATTSAARAEANTSASVAEADSQKTKATLQRLEAQLAEKAGRQQSEAQQVATARGELAQVETEAAGLEDAAEELARKLAESEEKAEETERKAMAVAQELMETSKSIARLRGEVLAGQSQNLRQSLEAAQREAGELDQRSRALGVPSPAGPLQGPREAEGRALNGALRSAWEHEAKERRKTEQQLEAAEATWLQVCEMLQSLTLVARRCRQEMIASGVAPTALPLPPDDAAWEDTALWGCGGVQ